MGFSRRLLGCLLGVVVGFAGGWCVAGDPPANADDPKSAYRDYIRAIRTHDLLAAKACWVVDSEDDGQALEVAVEFEISMRRVLRLAVAAFGTEAIVAIPEEWLLRATSDIRLEDDEQMLRDATVKITGDTATVVQKERYSEHDDGYWLDLRKVGGRWRIADTRSGRPGQDGYFALGGEKFKENLDFANEVIAMLEAGEFKTARELRTFSRSRLIAMHERWYELREKFQEEADKQHEANKAAERLRRKEADRLEREKALRESLFKVPDLEPLVPGMPNGSGNQPSLEDVDFQPDSERWKHPYPEWDKHTP